jgi:predicted nuclease with TOPRIM domain
MTSEIKAYIDRIQAKVQHLNTMLVTERERSGSLLAEVSRLNEVVENQTDELSKLQLDYEELTAKLTEEREPAPVQMNDLDVDALVKEIDFCIQQLKIANE